MKIELKKVRINERASHETIAFNAEIFVDGRRAGLVWNEGTGGSNAVRFEKASVWVEAREFIEAQPPVTLSDGVTIPMTEDFFFSMLIDSLQTAKEQAKLEKKALKMVSAAPPRFRVFIARIEDVKGLADLIVLDTSEEMAKLKITTTPKWDGKILSIREVETREQRLHRLLANRKHCSPALLIELDTALQCGEIVGPLA